MQNDFKNKKTQFFAHFLLPFSKNVVLLQAQNNGGTVAQLVEQRTENPRVTGSIPVGTTQNEETHCVRLFFLFASNTQHRGIKKKHLPFGGAF